MTLLLLFAWAFAAATILPLSSEVPLALALSRGEGWGRAVFVATLGNVLGACTTYGLARLAISAAPARSRRTVRAAAWLTRYGPPVLLLSWAPVVGDLLVALAGAARMPFGRFVAWTTVGKGARYLAVALAVTQR